MLVYTNPSPFGVMFLVKPFTTVDLITMFITRQPTQSSEFTGSSSGNSDSPCRLICQPCEPSGQGLVMWFRWVSHAGMSLPSLLSDPATVPHYTPCHRQPYRQRAWQFFDTETPAFFIFSLLGQYDRAECRRGTKTDRITYSMSGIPLHTLNNMY